MRRTLSVVTAVVCLLVVGISHAMSAASAELLVVKNDDVFLITLTREGVVSEVPISLNPGKEYALGYSRQSRRFTFYNRDTGQKTGFLPDLAFEDAPFMGSNTSPDDQWAAHNGVGNRANPVIKLERIDGTGERTLHGGESPRWSPDGTKLVFQSNVPNGIAVIDVATESFQVFAPGETPHWSPDGRWIAFIGGIGDVFVMRSDGSDLRDLTNEGDRFAHLTAGWTPDNRVIFVGGEDSRRQTGWQVINPDGSGREAFLSVHEYREVVVVSGTLPAGKPHSLAVSPDGRLPTTWGEIKAR